LISERSSVEAVVTLRLTADQLDGFPEFVYNEWQAPPQTWTSFLPWIGGPAPEPMEQRKRLAQAQLDITPDTRVRALDGEIGTVNHIELDPVAGRLVALWVRAGGIPPRDLRIPVELVERPGNEGSLWVAGTRADLEAAYGHDDRRHASS
jgi:hypothetical protein